MFFFFGALYVFRPESTSRVKLIADPGFDKVGVGSCFRNREAVTARGRWTRTRQTDTEQVLCKWLIEMMTCVAGEATCQEKSWPGKMPCQPTVHLIQPWHTLPSSKLKIPTFGLRSHVRTVTDLLVWSFFNSTHVFFFCLFFLLALYQRKERWYGFGFKAFKFLGPTRQKAEDGQHFVYGPVLECKQRTVCPVHLMWGKTCEGIKFRLE